MGHVQHYYEREQQKRCMLQPLRWDPIWDDTGCEPQQHSDQRHCCCSERCTLDRCHGCKYGKLGTSRWRGRGRGITAQHLSTVLISNDTRAELSLGSRDPAVSPALQSDASAGQALHHRELFTSIVMAEQAVTQCPFLASLAREQGTAFALHIAHQPLKPFRAGPVLEEADDFAATFALFHGRTGVVPLQRTMATLKAVSVTSDAICGSQDRAAWAPCSRPAVPCPAAASISLSGFGFLVSAS